MPLAPANWSCMKVFVVTWSAYESDNDACKYVLQSCPGIQPDMVTTNTVGRSTFTKNFEEKFGTDGISGWITQDIVGGIIQNPSKFRRIVTMSIIGMKYQINFVLRCNLLWLFGQHCEILDFMLPVCVRMLQLKNSLARLFQCVMWFDFQRPCQWNQAPK